MSCTDFPSAGLIPNVTTHTVGNITYIWTGIAWESQVNVPAGELVNDLSQAYIFDTVADYQASTIVFPVGKTIHLNDRQADFTVIAGTSTANGFNVIAGTLVNQSISLTIKTTMKTRSFGIVGNYSTVNDNAINAMFAVLPIGSTIDTGDGEDNYLFNNITMPLGFEFVGNGTFKGVAVGAKPTVAAMRATNSAGRLALLQAYTPSTITSTGTTNDFIKGTLNISQALIVSGLGSLKFQAKGVVNLEKSCSHNIGVSAAFTNGVINARELIVSDSPEDGVFVFRGGQVFMPFGLIISSAKRGGHVQLSGYFEIQDGEIHDSVDENLFTTGKTEVVAKRAIIANGLGIGVSMIYGGSGDFLNCVIKDNGGAGLSAESCSVILAEFAVITGNGHITGTGDGVNTSFQGFIQVRSSVITGNARFACYALTGGMIMAQETTVDKTNNGGAEQFKSLINGYIILDEPGTGNMPLLNRADCTPPYNTIGSSLSFIGRDDSSGGEDTGISVSRRQYGKRDILTIASGVVTATTGWIKINTESAGATDDLNTILYSDETPVDEIVIQPNTTGQTITLKHNTGNLRTFDGVDIVLSAKNKIATGLWNKDTSAWVIKAQ